VSALALRCSCEHSITVILEDLKDDGPAASRPIHPSRLRLRCVRITSLALQDDGANTRLLSRHLWAQQRVAREPSQHSQRL